MTTTTDTAEIKRCNCIEEIDNVLLANGCGYRLKTTLTFNDKMGIDVGLSLPTEWNDQGPRKRRKQPPPILCSFCPFCGAAMRLVQANTNTEQRGGTNNNHN